MRRRKVLCVCMMIVLSLLSSQGLVMVGNPVCANNRKFVFSTREQNEKVTNQYVFHNTISIDGDRDFATQAVTEGWPGNGTPIDPYIIEGYEITHSDGDLLVIGETTVHFIIRNNFINGLSEAWGGILLNNVINGIIANNTVTNIDILGIGIYFSQNIAIVNNEVKNTVLNGIRIEACLGPTLISNNTITNSQVTGIWVGDSSSKTTIRNNFISENQFGIVFGRDAANYMGVSFSFISYNLIFNNSLGMELSYSFNNSIVYNSVLDNDGYGVSLFLTCENTTVKWNNFTNNVGGNSQAKDDGIDNIFKFNYWGDWIGPDGNNDGIVDNPYEIDGDASNVDHSPLVKQTETPSRYSIPLNIVAGTTFLFLIIGVLAILLIKNRT